MRPIFDCNNSTSSAVEPVIRTKAVYVIIPSKVYPKSPLFL